MRFLLAYSIKQKSISNTNVPTVGDLERPRRHLSGLFSSPLMWAAGSPRGRGLLSAAPRFAKPGLSGREARSSHRGSETHSVATSFSWCSKLQRQVLRACRREKIEKKGRQKQDRAVFISPFSEGSCESE